MPSVTGDDDGAGYGVKGSSAAGSGVVGDGPAWAGVVATSVTGSGVSAFSDSGAGVSSVSNAGPGVVGESVNGVGVRARSDYGDALVASSGGAVGVRAASTVDNAVFAETHADDHASVYGFTRANGGTAVAGLAQCADGVGVFGAATSKGSGLFGQATAGGAGVTAVGYTGVVAQGGQGAGVEAWSLADDGVSGVATDRLASGVIGTNPTAGASGVAGMSVAGTGVYAESNTGAGVVAYSQSGIGVRATAAGGDPAVVAQGRGIGVRASGGVGAQITGSTLGAQIIGSETGATITGKEVGLGVEGDVYGASIKGKAIGLSAGSDQIAILASVYKGTAVLAATTEKSTIVGTVLQLGAAIHGKAGNPKAPSTYAGLFEGDVTVNGTLRKSSDHFVIDHPLDPAGKFLEHSVVESDEMKNVYDGVVTLDRRGSAVVRLSPWFEALNTRFRYQLTPIGGPAPNLHVAAELEDGRFEIGGGAPRLKVSWQITGVRRDAWAIANPLRVERRKVRKERGRYLHPGLFGAKADAGLFVATNAIPDIDSVRPKVEMPAAPEKEEPTPRRRRKFRAPEPLAPRATPVVSTLPDGARIPKSPG